jgi:putative phage-type endonuclease
MPIIEGLEQGTKAWHEFRARNVMATDIPVILGSNPWETKLERWEQKMGLRPPTELNDAMRRGMELEPEARTLAILKIGCEFSPKVFESSTHSWLAASLDGISDNEGEYILEIKCPKELSHLEAANGNIPEYYSDQIQTQLLVTNALCCFYFSYRPEYIEQPYVIIQVEPDPEKQAEIIEKGYEFYMQMCNFEPPVEWKLKERK